VLGPDIGIRDTSLDSVVVTRNIVVLEVDRCTKRDASLASLTWARSTTSYEDTTTSTFLNVILSGCFPFVLGFFLGLWLSPTTITRRNLRFFNSYFTN
jgi:hypothetical protein